ncbi:hypothetical protein K2173_018245 [Erythroxylum novogranatense]|uniref:pectinesterase n=1 Tax=Erythroxylum novogranatense TaxID=1862640 RepID=A0AAV8TLH0_9ROSI|nr:hypothetical protein K2173_018245 [Erythroxylum novogranatense]
MEVSSLRHIVIALLIFQLSTYVKSDSATKASPINTNADYIKTSCNVTLYPKLCYRTLSYYASKIKTDPVLLANTALNVSVMATKSTFRLTRKMSRLHGLSPREAAAMQDCVEVVGDSVYELQRSMGDMGHVNGTDFERIISDIKTWVSAALTDDDTCMDGLNELVVNGYVKIIVRKHIVRIAHLTSNALAIICTYASSFVNLH